MFNKYSYKIKFQLLLALIILLGLTAYRRSFSILYQLIVENKALNEKAAVLQDKSKNISLLRAELTAIDRILGKENINKEKVQQDIIKYIDAQDNVSLYSMESFHTFKDQDYTIYTYRVDITGNVNSLLATAYNFEKHFNYSKLLSLNFYTTIKNNKPDNLHLKLIFQNYENNK
jgi:hypothetical protein